MEGSMNSYKKLHITVVITLVLVAGLTQCSTSSEPESATDAYSEVFTDASMQKSLSTISTGELSNLEKEGLLFMREEEKLARDTYITLNEMYDLRVFNNISRSEQIHMNAIKYLLDRYQLEDPAEENDVGVYANSDLQTLYNSLIEAGAVNEIEALKVGALIEETDIADLQTHIAEIDDNEDIKFVYQNLLRASSFHLRAFVFNLRVRGVEYEPQILDQLLYMNYITD